LYHFLVVEHDSFEPSVQTVRKVCIPQTEARALPAFEAVSLGLMPQSIDSTWKGPQGENALRMTYHSLGGHRLLTGDPTVACDNHDPSDQAHVKECRHAQDSYRYTWYEARDGQEVHATFVESHYNLGQPLRTFSHAMLITGKTLSLPRDVKFTAQENASKASIHSSWWQPLA